MKARRIGVVIWCVLVTGCFLAVRSFLSTVFFLATFVLLFFCVVSVSKSRDKLRLTIDAPKQIRKNQKRSVRISLRNLSAYPVFSAKGTIVCRNELTGEIQEDSFQCAVKPYMIEKIPVKINSPFIGRVVVTVKDLTVYDLLGIFCYKIDTKAHTGVTLVIPEEAVSEETAAESAAEDGSVNEDAGRESSDEPSGVTEYKDGEPVANIHWKLSAKLDRLMVRDMSKQGAETLDLFLETDLPEKCFANLAQEASGRIELLLAVSYKFISEHVIHRIIFYQPDEEEFREYYIVDVDDLSRIMDTLLSVRFFSEGGYGTIQKYFDGKWRSMHFLYITDAGIEEFGEWINEQGITPLYRDSNE